MTYDERLEIQHIADYADRAVENLPSMHHNKPRIVALVRALAGPVQVLEDIVFDILTSWRIEALPGYSLDIIGKILCWPRAGLEHEDYRRVLLAVTYAYRCNSSPDEIIEVFKIVTNAESVAYFGTFPAAYNLVAYTDQPLSDIVRQHVRSLMGVVKPGGVGMQIVEASLTPFTYNSGPGYNVGPYSRVI